MWFVWCMPGLRHDIIQTHQLTPDHYHFSRGWRRFWGQGVKKGNWTASALEWGRVASVKCVQYYNASILVHYFSLPSPLFFMYTSFYNKSIYYEPVFQLLSYDLQLHFLSVNWASEVLSAFCSTDLCCFHSDVCCVNAKQMDTPSLGIS